MQNEELIIRHKNKNAWIKTDCEESEQSQIQLHNIETTAQTKSFSPNSYSFPTQRKLTKLQEPTQVDKIAGVLLSCNNH